MHIVVVGCGRVGSTVARSLAGDGHDVVVVDKRRESFVRLGEDFPGRTMVGVGFDRGLLERTGLGPDSAVMAVTSGDNSNILIARVARETLGVERVVARIYDPRRAAIYERLGIPTVASVSWTAARAMRHILPDPTVTDWVDPTNGFVLVERRVPAGAAGTSVADLESTGVRVALLTRLGVPQLPTAGLLLQQDDIVHLMTAAASSADDPFARPEESH